MHIGLYTETTNYFRTTSENYNKHKEDLVKKLDVDFKLWMMSVLWQIFNNMCICPSMLI